jgi:hypothetical protein
MCASTVYHDASNHFREILRLQLDNVPQTLKTHTVIITSKAENTRGKKEEEKEERKGKQ